MGFEAMTVYVSVSLSLAPCRPLSLSLFPGHRGRSKLPGKNAHPIVLIGTGGVRSECRSANDSSRIVYDNEDRQLVYSIWTHARFG